MIKPLSLVLIVTLLAVSPAFAQDANRADIQQTAQTQPAATAPEPQVRQSDSLPPQGEPAKKSHKKRNIIIGVVAAAAAGVAVAAHNGLYGSSKGY